MRKLCVIGKIKNISSCSDRYLEQRIKEENLPILKNHIPLFYYLPEDGSKILFNELAKRWKISKSSLSDIVSKYESLGLIERLSCPDDKRTVYLRLTKDALIIKEKIDSFEKGFLDKVLTDFSKEERETFENLIQKVLNNYCDSD